MHLLRTRLPAALRLCCAPGALVLSLTLTACSGTAATTRVTAADLTSSLPAARGEVNQIAWNLTRGEPSTIDPADAVSYSSGQVASNLCDSLMTVDDKFNLKPNLATAKQVSPTEVDFTVRKGATFWDGRTVTADDVTYSLTRSAKDTHVVSFVFVNVKTISAVGSSTVKVTFKEPDELFLHEMGNVSGAVMEKRYSEQAGDKLGTPAGGLMCSGPFKLTSWRSGSDITMSRNDHYWSPALRPFAKRVRFTFVTDATALIRALDAGEIDGAYELPASAVTTLRRSSSGRLAFGPSMQSVNLSLAQPGGVLADNRIRQALQRAVDREAVATKIFKGTAIATYTDVTPATWPNAQRGLYQPAYDKIVKKRSYDLDAARKLVRESSYKGQDIVLAVQAGDATANTTALLVQQEAKAVGLRVRVQSLQPLVASQAAYDASKRKGIDLLLRTSFNAAQDPLEPLGFDELPGQPYNYTNSDNAEVTKLLTQARRTFDPAERARLILRAQEVYEADSAHIPLVAGNTTMFLNKRLTGAITSLAYWSMPQMAYIGAAK